MEGLEGEGDGEAQRYATGSSYSPSPSIHLASTSRMKLTSATIWALALLLTPAIHAAVLAIDYGAEFTKLSLVKPGVPFDVVLDRDSKRKISSVVGWKREDRVFGAEGKMTVSAGRGEGGDGEKGGGGERKCPAWHHEEGGEGGWAMRYQGSARVQ